MLLLKDLQERDLKKKLAFVYAGIGLLAILAMVRFVFPALWPGSPPIVASKNCEAAYTSGYCKKNQKDCTVRVVMTQCRVAPTLVPAELAVCEKNTKITWKLEATGEATGAKFAYNGVDFVEKTEYKPRFDPKDEFQVKKRDTTLYEVMDKKSNDTARPDQYGYGIHILTSNASDCWHQDPMVSNE